MDDRERRIPIGTMMLWGVAMDLAIFLIAARVVKLFS